MLRYARNGFRRASLGGDFNEFGHFGTINIAAGPVTDSALNFVASIAIAGEHVSFRDGFLVGWSYTLAQAPVGVGTLTLTMFKAAAGGTPADPGSIYDVTVSPAAATQRGRLELVTPMPVARGDILSPRYSVDAAWNVATADLHVFAIYEWQ